MTNKKDISTKLASQKLSAHSPAARALAAGIIVFGVLGLYISSLAYPHPQTLLPTQAIDSAMLVIGAGLLSLQLLLAYALKHVQQGTYWFFWLQLKKTNLDERQTAVRQRVFERAYAYSLIIALLTTSSIAGMADYDPDVRNSLVARIVFAVGVILVSLPSILATSQKDS